MKAKTLARRIPNLRRVNMSRDAQGGTNQARTTGAEAFARLNIVGRYVRLLYNQGRSPKQKSLRHHEE